jgi:RND family efflux transporter MFP subunit
MAAAIVALAAGCGEKKTEHVGGVARTEPAAVTGVQVAAVVPEQVPLVRELAGSVRAASVSQVSARIMAQALSVPVAEGDAVSQGQLLATLDVRELQAKARQAEGGQRQAEAGLKQAQAQRDLAAATHARFRALLAGKAVSRQEYEQVAAQEAVAQAVVAQAESAVAQAESAVEEARTWLGFAELRAPAAGRVVTRRIDPGSMASPGAPLFTIEQEGRLRVELPADVALSGAVGKGTRLNVSVDAAGFAGEVAVTEVVAAADPVTRTFLVKADLPAHPGLRSGQFARVTLAVGTRAAVTVPEAALVRRGQLDGVFVLEAGERLSYRIVQLGRESAPGRREVLAGLAAGEQIVVGGIERARDGARVAGAR